MDDKLWRGVEALLDDYVMLGPEDVVLLLYTSDSLDSAIWVSSVLAARGVPHQRMWMIPLIDPEFGARLVSMLPEPQSLRARLAVLTFERDTMSHTRALTSALSRYDPARLAVFRTISASAALFRTALLASPSQLSARNAALLYRLLPAKRLRIRTKGGTDLEVELDSDRHRWISNRGMARTGGTVILPAGEVATYPASISGVHIADFAFNLNAIVTRDARLNTHPVEVRIENGRVSEYRCADPGLTRFLDETLGRECAFNVGELGFGTNYRVRRPIRLNSHINERRPGVHIGLGQHNQNPGVVSYQCPVHLDLIANGGKVWIDDDPRPLDLAKIIPSRRPHPSAPRDEDVFSPEVGDFRDADCCGILTEAGFQPTTCPSA